MALQRLEQLRRDIQAARWRREQASAEFEAFVASFREPGGPRLTPAPPVPPQHVAAAAAPALLTPTRAESGQIAQPGAPGAAAPAPATSAAEPRVPASSVTLPAVPVAAGTSETAGSLAPPPAFDLDTEPDASEIPALPDTRKRGSGGVWLSLVAVLGAAAAIGFILLRSGAQPPAAVPAAAIDTAVDARSVVASPAPAPAEPVSSPPAVSAEAAPVAPAAQPRALRLELVAVEPVWIRVTVDGRRTIEREVPAEFRTTLDADRAIAIRAGNAGALMVAENGSPPAPLGREGQVMTRIFPSPSSR